MNHSNHCALNIAWEGEVPAEPLLWAWFAGPPGRREFSAGCGGSLNQRQTGRFQPNPASGRDSKSPDGLLCSYAAFSLCGVAGYEEELPGGHKER